MLVLVLLATFPVTIPFLVINDPMSAKNASDAIALVMLFIGGVKLGQLGGFRPLLSGLFMVLLGATLVLMALTIGG